jgi:hypothetical protein
MIISEIGCWLTTRVSASSSGTSSTVAFLVIGVILDLSSITKISIFLDTSLSSILIVFKDFISKGVLFVRFLLRVSTFFHDAKIFH